MEQVLIDFSTNHLVYCPCGSIDCARNKLIKELPNSFNDGMGLYFTTRGDPDEHVFLDLADSVCTPLLTQAHNWLMIKDKLRCNNTGAINIIFMGRALGIWEIDSPDDLIFRSPHLKDVEMTPHLLNFMVKAGLFGYRLPNDRYDLDVEDEKQILNFIKTYERRH
jgi:hypothetical protein